MQDAGLTPPGGVLEYFEDVRQIGQRRRCTKEPLKIDKNVPVGLMVVGRPFSN